MVLEEYFLLIAISIICYFLKTPEFYLALIMAYNIHIIGHIFQAIYLKSYVPGIVLGTASFIILAIQLIESLPLVDVTMVIMFVPICLFILVANLWIIHKFF
nr:MULTISPECIES: HXXEE domain-containing protein [unclassified Enterococcus]